MSDLTDICASMLKESGYSLTKPRLLIFGLLADNPIPLSMSELSTQASGEIDRASVYRTVELFEKLGIVNRINIGWKYKLELSDRFAEHHHHLTCLRCQKIIPINEHDMEHFIESIAAANQFQTTEHQVEIQGYCADCRNRSG